jgi:hypothetical protein
VRLKSPTEATISFGTKNGSGHCMVLGPEGDDVPQMLVQPAFSAGAVPADADPEEFVSLPVQTAGKTTGELIQDGIKAMIERDEEGDFTASGMPDRRKLAKVVGLNVTAEEMAVAWRAVNESV